MSCNACAILPPRLFGSVAYYALIRRYDKVYIDTAMRYDKAAKDVHRFEIADTRGRLRLTIPVSRPEGARQWCDLTVSSHGRWYETMPVALASAYGRTPFFEYYIDRLMPVFTDTNIPITHLDAMADAIVRRTIALPTEVIYGPAPADLDLYAIDDYRHSDINTLIDTSVPYWQVRATTFGFLENLSILDAMFSLGPETDIYLEKLKLYK